MTLKRRLAAWIGHHDLWAMGEALGGSARDHVVAALGPPWAAAIGAGPIRTLVSQIDLDRLHLLSDYEGHPDKYGDRIGEVIREFIRWLNCPAEVHRVQLTDPTSYEDVFRVSDSVLRTIWSQMDVKNETLCIHVSPGTPTMAAVWVLLAKTRYPAVL